MKKKILVCPKCGIAFLQFPTKFAETCPNCGGKLELRRVEMEE